MKLLLRGNDAKARKRFRREAAAYETTSGVVGVPLLLDHNAHQWDDTKTQLYLALELIEGTTLKDRVSSGPAASLEEAFACLRTLADVLQQCHQQGVTHRDVKPRNIMLRGGNITEPVLVDFGLTFNSAEDDDLTKVGDEVGNRFLRLPEHAFGGRDAESDITQLAGIFLYILTGVEPRVLVDAKGLTPHQRTEARELLASLFSGRPLLRVQAVFDRAFASTLMLRYRKATDFVSELENAMDDSLPDYLPSLLAQVDKIALDPMESARAAQREVMARLIHHVSQAVGAFAAGRNLEMSQTSYRVVVTPTETYAENHHSVSRHGDPPHYQAYRVEPRGPDEYVVLVNDQPVWRGNRSDPTLDEAITRAAAEAFLRHLDSDS